MPFFDFSFNSNSTHPLQDLSNNPVDYYKILSNRKKSFIFQGFQPLEFPLLEAMPAITIALNWLKEQESDMILHSFNSAAQQCAHDLTQVAEGIEISSNEGKIRKIICPYKKTLLALSQFSELVDQLLRLKKYREVYFSNEEVMHLINGSLAPQEKINKIFFHKNQKMLLML